ncbi:hypothetical protein IE81DRAFT_347257 [Ceraceosorus guamensis]|uniref:Uncharacterized protein n=1 Tax=Ceraceosorus guamensis TaxID=1522189 RepID=A0A316VZH4_9BASI|nr:hypothetical protein IE81DRAFT_347257 [Ceraceosorus guamensis]PWN42704.1 hypothetical protein IE81DRAFT_347257 [Ceraceosorus guamensis]
MFIAKIPYRASFGRALDALWSTTRRSEAIVRSHGQRSPMRASSSAGRPEPDETLLPEEDFSTHKFPALGLDGVYASKRARAESRAELKDAEKAKHLRIQRYSVTRYFEENWSGNGAPCASSDECTPLHSSQEADAQQRQGSTPRQRRGRTVRIDAVPFGQVTLHLNRFARGGDGMEKDREYPSYLPWPPDIAWATGKLMRQYEAFKRAREGKDVNDSPLLRLIVITTIKEFGRLATVRRRGRVRVYRAVWTAARDMDAADTRCLDGALLVIRPRAICAERHRPSAPPPTLQEGEVHKSKRAAVSSQSDTKGRSETATRSREHAIHMDDLVRSALDLLKRCVAESQTLDGRAKRGALETARSSASRGGKRGA